MMKREFLPKTAGLLISMALRSDHSFGFDTGTFCSGTDLEAKQLRLIETANAKYNDIVKKAGFECFGIDPDAQVKEEMTGRGFYRPALEYTYRQMATLEACARALEIEKNGN